jgi:hypothetical protein
MSESPYPFQHKWDASHYSEPFLAIRHSEADIQRMVVHVLQGYGCLTVNVDAGAKVMRGRAAGALMRAGVSAGAARGALLGRTGAASRGTPDVLGCSRYGEFIALEVKVPAHVVDGRVKRSAGKPSDEQLRWLSDAHRRGAIVAVVWGPTDIPRLFHYKLDGVKR